VGGEIDINDVARALGMGFRRALGVDLSRSVLFAKEKRLARQLLRGKYMRPEWTFARQ
jgi:lipoate-protein ligase A